MSYNFQRQSSRRIARSIILSFVGITVATMISATVAFIAFERVSISFKSVADQNVPAVKDALILTALSERLSRQLELLSSAKQPDILQKHEQAITQTFTSAQTALNRLDQELTTVQEMASLLATVNERIQKTVEISHSRLKLAQQSTDIHAIIEKKGNDLQNRLTPLIVAQNAKILTIARDSISDSSGTVRTLIDDTILDFQILLGARADIITSINAIAIAEPGEIKTVTKKSGKVLRRVERKFKRLSDKDLTAQGQQIIQKMRTELANFAKRPNAGLSRNFIREAQKLAAIFAPLQKALQGKVKDLTIRLVSMTSKIAEASENSLVSNVSLATKDLEQLLTIGESIRLLMQSAQEITQVTDKSRVSDLEKVEKTIFLQIAQTATAMSEQYDMSGGLDAIITDISKLESLFLKSGDSLLAMRRQALDLDKEASDLVTNNLLVNDQLKDYLAQQVSTATHALDQEDKNLKVLLDQATNLLLIIAGSCILMSALIAVFYINRRVIRRLSHFTDAMTRIAQGDLQAPIPEGGKDEITIMSNALRYFRDRTAEVDAAKQQAEEIRLEAEEERKQSTLHLSQSFEQSVMGALAGVTQSFQEITKSAEKMRSFAETTTRQSDSVASESETTADSVEAVAAATQELVASIEEIKQQVNQSSQITHHAVTKTTETTKTIESLSVSSNNISEIVAHISNIADQTNLLALNATIEAARAGEAGRGFVVVASEVKTLAHETATMTDDIRQQVDSIQNATVLTVRSISEIGEAIERVNGAIQAIVGAVEQQGATTQEIAENISRASTSSAQLSRDIKEVADVAAASGQAAESANLEIEQGQKQVIGLENQVAGFLNDIRPDIGDTSK